MADLYWKNVGADNSWNNVNNWFTDAEATIQAANVPWVAGDSTYLAYNLHRSTDSLANVEGVYINAEIVVEVTGECTISGDLGSTDGLIINGTNIYGGTFSGNVYNDFGNIYGGTFEKELWNVAGTIYNGIFSGDGFININMGIIYGGIFSGNSFDNSGSGSIIYGGIFSVAGFTNSGTIHGGNWLTKGSIKAGDVVITGKYPNPVPYDTITAGFMTIMGSSDILGGGLL